MKHKKEENIFENINMWMQQVIRYSNIIHYINIVGNPNKEVSRRALKSIFERTSIVSSKILRLMFENVRKRWYLKELAEVAGCRN